MPLTPDSVRLATAPTSPEIIILKSGDNGFFNGPAEGFLETIDAKVSVFTLSESSSREVVAGIQLANPQLIFALGTAATKLASRHFKDDSNHLLNGDELRASWVSRISLTSPVSQ